MPDSSESLTHLRQQAEAIFRAGLEAVEPAAAIGRHCHRNRAVLVAGDNRYDLTRFRNIYVVGAGKAAAPMAAAVEMLLKERLTAGMVTVKYGHSAPLNQIHIAEAGHPVPDDSGARAAARILEMASRAGPDDLVICLISGGASALMPLPVTGITLAEKQAVNRLLLACGADIHEMNTVRKHLSAIKGGQLARAAHPATLLSLILSDVVGDDLDVIGSGPTVADTTTFADCIDIIARYHLAGDLPGPVTARIRAGLAGKVPETPKPGEAFFARSLQVVVGSNLEAARAAMDRARTMGFNALILSTMITGDTAAAAQLHGAIAREVVRSGLPVPPPACIISGGETTVAVTGSGTGGRNQEFALHAALAIAGAGEVVILSAGTDGTDGPTDAAGAMVDGETIRRAKALGLDPHGSLAQNDSYPFFRALGDLLITGPTCTNVMDLRIVLVGNATHDA
ncbi:MAG: glycerate kinase [Desulfobacterales bacterium]|nr:glycerate kinase [Desulfobacterales bacterium]